MSIMDTGATVGTGMDAAGALGKMEAMTQTTMAMQTGAAVMSAKKEINATVDQTVHDVASNAKNLARAG
ncbi:hypothetical protein GWC77_04830 [Paraburkholderia sp. NMBU_R16]|jgi:hypothetical protein|uniref:hypothetical protein n=1 Tax=Paraburkholderia sp. NMBU_R16 TaxID=2698676 RepID=UPI0015639567|nr:hypothetical protein [Paraburkholderia sp. NMBU_R16]NRO95261.1 hypothetical protein [Paraburkholderia sp. NMBU_R16]